MKSDYQFFASTPKRLESLLADELAGLGAEQVSEKQSGVGFTGSLEVAYRACLFSRLANRILLSLGKFPAESPEELYNVVREIDWSDHFGLTSTFAVDLTAKGSSIGHTKFAALKVKDAIVDQFRDRFGSRPSVRLERPDIKIHAHIENNVVQLSLDLSGESLHRRGYRETGGQAPLKENLAAALLLRAKWPEISSAGGGFIDPMCGSGTLLIEAALMAADIAPGSMREYFGFLKWKQHQPECWKSLIKEAGDRRRSGMKDLVPIVGYDIDKRIIKAAWTHITRAGLEGFVHVEKKSAFDARPLESFKGQPGLIAANPPYGQRIGDTEQLMTVYRGFGDTLKEHFIGWRAAVLTGDPELGFQLGIRSKKPYHFFNGAIECKLLILCIEPERYFEPKGPMGKEDQVSRIKRNARRNREDQDLAVEMFANRLKKNLRNLKRWAQREGVDCYRIYDADLPEYAMAIDLYQGHQRWAHVQEYSAPATVDPKLAEIRLTSAVSKIATILDISLDNVLLKIRRPQKGLAQYQKVNDSSRFFEVLEGENRFLVNLHDYIDTGLFLDHRITRELIRDCARGKHFLNLFGYTGSASVYAVKGGAISTTTVDMSKSYLDWAKRNLALNGITGSEHTLVAADCLEWLREAGKRNSSRRSYDLIFVDPPTFSNSKTMTGDFNIQRDHRELIEDVVKLLAPGGLLLFSTNYKKFKLDSTLTENFAIQDISRSTISKDFSRSPKIHHCWEIRLLSDGDTRFVSYVKLLNINKNSMS